MRKTIENSLLFARAAARTTVVRDHWSPCCARVFVFLLRLHSYRCFAAGAAGAQVSSACCVLQQQAAIKRVCGRGAEKDERTGSARCSGLPPRLLQLLRKSSGAALLLGPSPVAGCLHLGRAGSAVVAAMPAAASPAGQPVLFLRRWLIVVAALRLFSGVPVVERGARLTRGVRVNVCPLTPCSLHRPL